MEPRCKFFPTTYHSQPYSGSNVPGHIRDKINYFFSDERRMARLVVKRFFRPLLYSISPVSISPTRSSNHEDSWLNSTTWLSAVLLPVPADRKLQKQDLRRIGHHNNLRGTAGMSMAVPAGFTLFGFGHILISGPKILLTAGCFPFIGKRSNSLSARP